MEPAEQIANILTLATDDLKQDNDRAEAKMREREIKDAEDEVQDDVIIDQILNSNELTDFLGAVASEVHLNITLTLIRLRDLASKIRHAEAERLVESRHVGENVRTGFDDMRDAGLKEGDFHD
jgi:hypothetical protein